MILDARDLVVGYPALPAPVLEGVSLHVAAGELVAVVGPNGCGKTTLLRALLGTVPRQAGQVTIAGRALEAWAPGELATVVAAVAQREEPALPIDVVSAVLFGRYARLGPLAAVTPADRAAAREALERCDAWHLRARGIDTLSGGEWQRVRIARALAQAPRLLALDEPTAALDVRHEMETMELVRGLADGGLGALVITHHLNLAARYADRLVLMARGRVVADGAPLAVLTRDTLARAFEWPVAVTTWCDGSPQVVPLRPGEESA